MCIFLKIVQTLRIITESLLNVKPFGKGRVFMLNYENMLTFVAVVLVAARKHVSFRILVEFDDCPIFRS